MFRSLLLALPLLATPALAQNAMVQRTDMGEAAIDAFAQAIDLNGDNQISPIELNTAGRLTFAAMDADADGLVTRSEMVTWDEGMRSLAEFRDRVQAYEATMGLVFTLFDTDGGKTLTQTEYQDGLGQAWRFADRDFNGLMSIAEFRDDFFVVQALREAVTE